MPASAEISRHALSPRPGPGRVEEAEPRVPSYTPLMLLLSLLYIVLTLAFGARVLDTVGTAMGDQQLFTLATLSHTLFGCALTLALWGSCVFPWMEGTQLSWRRRWLALVCAGAIAMAASFGLQRIATAWMVEDDTGLRGRKALQLMLLTHAALDAHIPVAELRLTDELLASPAGKAFLALLLATELTDDQARPATDAAIRQAMQTLAAQRVGTAAQVYDNIFVPSVRSLKDAYNAYVAAQIALVDDIKAIADQQTQAWNDYLEGLAKRGLSLGRLTRADWPAIASDVRQSGIAVPTDWNPADQAGFTAAFAAQRRRQADTQYGERLRRLFGAELPPRLEWEQFHANPVVQARWRAAIQAPPEAILSPTMGFRAFEETIHRPMITQIIQPKLLALAAPASAYAPGATSAPTGNAAALRIALPAIALVLALAGIVWHGCGMAAYALRLIIPRWPGRRRCLALALGICGLFVLGARGPIARSDGFNRLQDQIADRAGPIWLAALGMVEAYGLIQPGGELLRRTVLGNQDFGLDPLARPTADQQAFLDRFLP